MSIDQTWDEDCVPKLERLRSRGIGDSGVGANRRDPAFRINENGAVLDRRRRDGVDTPRANPQRDGQGEMPVPNPECTGQSLVGSVPGKNQSKWCNESGQNGVARNPFDQSTSRAIRESGRGQSAGAGRRS
jgi:hypothetical protein